MKNYIKTQWIKGEKKYMYVYDWKRSEMKKNKKLFYFEVNIGGQRVSKKTHHSNREQNT